MPALHFIKINIHFYKMTNFPCTSLNMLYSSFQYVQADCKSTITLACTCIVFYNDTHYILYTIPFLRTISPRNCINCFKICSMHSKMLMKFYFTVLVYRSFHITFNSFSSFVHKGMPLKINHVWCCSWLLPLLLRRHQTFSSTSLHSLLH